MKCCKLCDKCPCCKKADPGKVLKLMSIGLGGAATSSPLPFDKLKKKNPTPQPEVADDNMSTFSKSKTFRT